MKLRFNHPSVSDKFAALVRRHGFAADQYLDAAGWIVVQSAIEGAPKRKLMREWALFSMEDETLPQASVCKPDKKQEEFDY